MCNMYKQIKKKSIIKISKKTKKKKKLNYKKTLRKKKKKKNKFRNETYPSQEKPSKSKPKDLKKEINNTLVNVSNTTRKKIKFRSFNFETYPLYIQYQRSRKVPTK